MLFLLHYERHLFFMSKTEAASRSFVLEIESSFLFLYCKCRKPLPMTKAYPLNGLERLTLIIVSDLTTDPFCAFVVPELAS